VPDSLPTYFVPGDGDQVTTVIGLENEAAGYAYEASGQSPVATGTVFFEKPLPDGRTLCGPPLRVVGPGGSTVTEDSLTLDDSVVVRRLPDGALLLREGPRVMDSFYGSGQCGACPRVGLTLLHLAPDGIVTPALEFFETSEAETSEIDIAVADAWDSVWVYRSSTTDFEHYTWRETTYCLKAGDRAYAVCAERDSVPEPKPRHIVYDP
jgi:hypothetical protein